MTGKNFLISAAVSPPSLSRSMSAKISSSDKSFSGPFLDVNRQQRMPSRRAWFFQICMLILATLTSLNFSRCNLPFNLGSINTSTPHGLDLERCEEPLESSSGRISAQNATLPFSRDFRVRRKVR